MKKLSSKIIISLFLLAFSCTSFSHATPQKEDSSIHHQNHQKVYSNDDAESENDNISCCESHEYVERTVLTSQPLIYKAPISTKFIPSGFPENLFHRKILDKGVSQNSPPSHIKSQPSVLQLS